MEDIQHFESVDRSRNWHNELPKTPGSTIPFFITGQAIFLADAKHPGPSQRPRTHSMWTLASAP